MLVNSFLHIDEITNDDALMFINLKEPTLHAMRFRNIHTKFLNAMELGTKWKYVQRIVWFMPNKQHINPLKNKTFFTKYTEDIFFFINKKAFDERLEVLNKSNIGLPLSEDYLKDKRYEKSRERMIAEYGKLFRDIGDLWTIPIYKYNQKLKKYNPAEFPVELVEMAIKSHKDYGKRELVVLDPFIGGGTTAVAALRNGCRIYGSDISETYIKRTKERIENEGLVIKHEI